MLAGFHMARRPDGRVIAPTLVFRHGLGHGFGHRPGMNGGMHGFWAVDSVDSVDFEIL